MAQPRGGVQRQGHYGHPQGGAQSAGHVHHPAGRGRLSGRDRRHDRRVVGRYIGAQADAEQAQPGRYHDIRGGDGQRGGAAAGQQPAGQAAAPVRPAGGQDLLAGHGGQPEPGGQRGQQQPRVHHAAAVGGQDLRDEHQRPEQHQVGAQCPGQQRPRTIGGQHLQINQRRGRAPLPPHQARPGQQRHGRAPGQPGPRQAEPGYRRHGDQRPGGGRGQQDQPQRVGALAGGALTGARQQEPARRHRHHPDRDIDEEDRPPARRGDQQPARHRAQRQAHRLRTSLHAQGRPPPPGRSAGRHQRHAVGLQHRCSGRLHHPDRDQHAQRGGQPAPRRRRGEQHEPVQVHQLAAIPVRPAAHRHQQRDQRQQVGQRHPLHPGQGHAVLALQRGERQRHHAGIQLPHERPEAHRGHRQPRRHRMIADHRRAGPARAAASPPAAPRGRRWPGLPTQPHRPCFCRRTIYCSITEGILWMPPRLALQPCEGHCPPFPPLGRRRVAGSPP